MGALLVVLPFATIGAAAGFSRATLDPPYDEARAPSPAASPGAEHARDRPRVSAALPPAPAGLPLVTLTPRVLLLGNTRVTDTPPLPSLAATGFGALDKHGGPSDLKVAPLFEVLEAARARADATSGPGPRPQGVRLQLFSGAPYRALVELLYTAGQAGYTRFYLLADGADGAGQHGDGGAIEYWLPAGRTHCRTPPAWAALTIDVLLMPHGIAVRTDEGPVGQDCAPGAGLAFRPGIDLDVALPACLESVRRRSHEATDLALRLTAHPATPVGEIYQALLALRQPAMLEEPDGLPVLTVPVSPASIEAWQSPPELAGRLRERALGKQLSTMDFGGLLLGQTPAPSASATAADRRRLRLGTRRCGRAERCFPIASASAARAWPARASSRATARRRRPGT